jgi:hypothetical protein
MSHLQYKAYAGWGETAAKSHNMSQIVRVPAGDIVKMSGQGGWNPSDGEMVADLGGEWAKVRYTSLSPPFLPSSFSLSFYKK